MRTWTPGWISVCLATILAWGCGDLAGEEAEQTSGTNPDGSQNFVGAPLQFECDVDVDPSVTDMRRLSIAEYFNSVYALAQLIPDGDQVFWEELATTIELLPSEDARNYAQGYFIDGASFRNLDHDVTERHAEIYYDVAVAYADAALLNAVRREAVLGGCAVDDDTDNDADCVDDFIRGFGLLAFRRALRDAELSFFRDTIYGDGSPVDIISIPALRDVLVVMLNSPDFLYHVQGFGTPVDGRDDRVDLTAYELASRLSFLFWQSPPDAELLASAADGSLLTDDGVYRSHVERMFDDDRTAATIDSFMSQWLLLDHVPDHDALVGGIRYDAFRGDYLPTPELRDHMIEEIMDLANYFTFDVDGHLSDLFLTDISFARHDDLAELYGVSTWDGSMDNLVSFPEGERAGILTRAALLTAETHQTSPIMKGVLIRRNILCDRLIDPPANINTDIPLEPPFTRREGTAALTEQAGSSCASCHGLINSFGYATENFDALGRTRTDERFILEDGSILATMPVDTAVIPSVLPADATPAADGIELSQIIVDSHKVDACMARTYFRFAYARPEDLDVDGCTLEGVRRVLADGGTLRDVFMSVVFQDSFRQRLLGEL